MKTKFYWILLFLLPAIMGSYAQQTEDQKKEINKIKKSSLYLYAETTMPDKEEAMATAIDILQREAQKWVNEKRKKKETDADWDLVMTNVTQSYNQIELPRGNMYRAFAYVKKSDILTTKNVIVSDLENPAPEEETAEEAIAESPKAQPAELPEAVTEEEALHMAREIYRGGAQSGYSGSFRYQVAHALDGRSSLVICLDVSSQQRSVVTVLLVSTLIGLLCWLAMLMPVTLLSRKAIRPIAISAFGHFLTRRAGTGERGGGESGEMA